MKMIDTVHDYEGYSGCASKCRIRIYQDPERRPPRVVIATEVPDNEGTSVTNMAEHLVAEWTRDEQGGEPIETMWVEHYPEERSGSGRRVFEETFAVVSLRRGRRGELTNPEWKYITRAEVERLIGEAVG